MKKILGLDLGTNSIGWALVESDFDKKEGAIVSNGSRIIPMSKDIMDKFGTGQSISQTAERTSYRGTRRLYQKHHLRRERLHRTLNVLGFLPKHYQEAIDFEKHFGQFKKGGEVKLNYIPNINKKDNFLFNDSFLEMVAEFKKEQPHLFAVKENGKEAKIPYDWTLYYLRKKALIQKISKEELAWVLLNFNQKRGYYQLRGEEEEEDKSKSFETLKVNEIIDTGEEVKGKKLYKVIFENGWEYDKLIVKTEEWENKVREFIVSTKLNKDGAIKRTYKKVDSEKDWIAIKAKTQQNIEDFNVKNNTVGIASYIYSALLQNSKQKVNGDLVKTIERKFYKQELRGILKTQLKFHVELQDKKLYKACVEELYSRNEAHQINIKDKDFAYLFIEDIIFYQRPLKSKKSTISNCQYENRTYWKINTKTGLKEKIEKPLKAISKSNPLFLEFRLWQFLRNLKIYKIEDENDIDITANCLSNDEDWCNLFDFLTDKKEVAQKHIIEYFIKLGSLDKKEKATYCWNYVTDRAYPINETSANFLNRFKKVENLNVKAFLTKEVVYQLWHIVYSVKDKKEFKTALKTFAQKHNLDEITFVKAFETHPPYSADYGSYSEKAIKKLLPLMRIGKYWNENDIDEIVAKRVSAIFERIAYLRVNENAKITEKNLRKAIDAVADDAVPKQFIKSFLKIKEDNPLKGLNTYQACYAVYERHSEASEITQWKAPKDIGDYLRNFKQHSLRNPIVEQVVTETLRTVKSIWENELEKDSSFKFDEIHLELGRDMKNSKDKRKRISARQTENEKTNTRIKELLEELKNENLNIRSYSPNHQEKLKIYEEGVSQNPEVSYAKLKEDDVMKIRRNAQPSKSEIIKYKLWLEQGYVSPYTGRVIRLSDLFTVNYEVEHIIPQSRFFDNSLNNKIICEAGINRDKSNKTAYKYLKEKGGSIVDGIRLFSLNEYENHCNKYFKKNRTKLKNLLSEEVPEGFIQRQMNDSRYISKFIKGLLSNVVREEGEKEVTSKNLITVSGAITSRLKQDWGLNNQWNEIIQPRFERLNTIRQTEEFGYWSTQKDTQGKPTGKRFFRLTAPKGVDKKRIDHRHHSLDAIIIACCTKEHVNYITSLETERTNFKLVRKLRNQKEVQKKNRKGELINILVAKEYKQPWKDFSLEVKRFLETTIISFKQNTRVINKANNKTWQWVQEKEGKLKKKLVPQTKGNNWAIRKPLHKETVSGFVKIKQLKKGEVNIVNYLTNADLIVDKEIKKKVKSLSILFDGDIKVIKKHLKQHPVLINGIEVQKIKVYEWTKNATASRVALTDKFTRKQLESITDSGIQKIVENHLKNYIDAKGKECFELAFNIEGVEELNKNLSVLNNNKPHQPIYKVRLYEQGNKFPVSDVVSNLNKTKKYVEAAKGTNLFFAIYWNEEKKQRVYETIPLHEVIAWQKNRAETKAYNEPIIPVKPGKGQFLFHLSPNDLVYIPTEEEIENPSCIDFKNLTKEQVHRIYKMVSCTGAECHFVQNQVASEIEKNENGTNSKNERIHEVHLHELDTKGKTKMIKSICWKLNIDRLGVVTQIFK